MKIWWKLVYFLKWCSTLIPSRKAARLAPLKCSYTFAYIMFSSVLITEIACLCAKLEWNHFKLWSKFHLCNITITTKLKKSRPQKSVKYEQTNKQQYTTDGARLVWNSWSQGFKGKILQGLALKETFHSLNHLSDL